MAWFKCSTELLNRPEFVRLLKPIKKRDNGVGYRLSCVITVLCQAADGQYYIDSKHLQVMTGVGIIQAEHVWNELIKEGVLRLENGFYSAKSWLLDNRYIGKDKEKQRNNRRIVREHDRRNTNKDEVNEEIVTGEAAERYKAELLRIVGSK